MPDKDDTFNVAKELFDTPPESPDLPEGTPPVMTIAIAAQEQNLLDVGIVLITLVYRLRERIVFNEDMMKKWKDITAFELVNAIPKLIESDRLSRAAKLIALQGDEFTDKVLDVMYDDILRTRRDK